MSEHARLSPSSASRWLTCTASVELAETYPDESSEYADEGTRAHERAEIEASDAMLDGWLFEDYERALETWAARTDPAYHDDMKRYAEQYADYLRRIVSMTRDPQLFLETRVITGIPDCWGTADAVILSGTEKHVTVVDYKYGRGVEVKAQVNTQLMLYGLGVLETFGPLADIETLSLNIFQPRIGNQSTWTVSAEYLRAWRDTVAIPAAERIATGATEFKPSEEACRFCPAKGDCKARFEKVILEDFGASVEGSADDGRMSAEELARALEILPEVKSWAADVEKAALSRAYEDGERIPGYKVVMSGGRRSVPDQTAAVQTLIDAGYDAVQVAKFNLRPLGELEKLVGKSDLPKVLDGLLVKSDGRPSIVPEDDKRPAVDRNADAVRDFSEGT